MRNLVMRDHGRRRAIEPYIAWPVLGIAGQRHPTLGVDLPSLREGAPARLDVQRQPLGPHATEFGGVDWLARFCIGRRREWAAAELLVVQHPALPFAQRRRNCVLGARRH
jgi:hypothetical protein